MTSSMMWWFAMLRKEYLQKSMTNRLCFHALRNRRGHLPRQFHLAGTTTTWWYDTILWKANNFIIHVLTNLSYVVGVSYILGYYMVATNCSTQVTWVHVSMLLVFNLFLGYFYVIVSCTWWVMKLNMFEPFLCWIHLLLPKFCEL